MSYELIKATRYVDGWSDVYEEVLEDCSEIIHSITKGEQSWNNYLLSEGRSLPNLTEDNLNQLNLYFHNFVCNLVGMKNEQRECGGGLHLSPTPELALSYNKGKVLKCKVNIEDFVVYSQNISKVRCKKVKVLGEGDK